MSELDLDGLMRAVDTLNEVAGLAEGFHGRFLNEAVQLQACMQLANLYLLDLASALRAGKQTDEALASVLEGSTPIPTEPLHAMQVAKRKRLQ